MTVSPSNPPNFPSDMSRLEKIVVMFRAIQANNTPGYQRVRDYITAGGRIHLDRYALYQGGDNGSPGLKFPNSWSQAKRDWHAVQKIERLGHKLDIRSINRKFLMVFMNIYDPNMMREFRDDPLTFANAVASLPNPRRIYIPGFAENIFSNESNAYSVPETNIIKYLRRALGTTFRISEPYINWALYTFYGSQAFRYVPRFIFWRNEVALNSNSGGSNTNSNSGSNSNSRHSNSGAYKANTTRVKKNQNRNKNNKRIQWSKVTLKNAPRNEITFSNFSNGDKVVKLSWKLNSKTHSQYVSPQTFRNVARMSMTEAFNKAGNFTLFKNPFTRGMTKRSNIDFVILDLPRTRAATKIQKVVRGSQVRTKIRRNAERLASLVQRSAAKKRKRS